MKIFKKISILMVFFFIIMGLGHTAFAAKKTLRVGSGNVTNTGTTNASREVLLDIMLENGFNDVNGVVFTLVYDKDVFDFIGLFQNDKPIDNGDGYDPEKPPESTTIAQTIYYQANNKADKGVVLIAAAAAKFFTTKTDTYVPFKAKFRVKKGAGQGRYDIRVQKTIIGPDTAKNAGYDEATPIPVATGLAPDAELTTAQNYEVALVDGVVTVGGGHQVKGTVVYDSVPKENADGAVVSLYPFDSKNDLLVDSTVVKNGEFSFAGVGKGEYKVTVSASTPGFSKNAEQKVIVADKDQVLNPIILAKHSAVKGKITLKGGASIPGMTVLIKDKDGKVIGRIATDKNGNFVTFPIPAVNQYTFWAVYGNATPVKITPGKDLSWDLALGSVSGTIKGLANGQKVEVSVKSETTKLDAYALVTGNAAGADQKYEIKYLLPGSDYVVAVVGQGVPPTFYNNVSTLDGAFPVTVTADKNTPLDPFVFNAADVKSISGNVKIDGKAAPGKTVYASNMDFNNYKVHSALTDKDGKFTIQVVKDSYYVYVEHKGSKYYFKTLDKTVQVVKDAVKVDVTKESKNGIDLKVAVSTSSVDGVLTLKREDGLKMVNVLVEARNKATGAANITRTNVDGHYLIDNLNQGGHVVTVFPPNPYAPISQDVNLKKDEKATKDFIVGKDFTLTGTVLAESAGTPAIQGAWVTLFNKDNGVLVRPSVKTNATGEFTLADIPTGIYILSVYHQDYQDKDTEVMIDKDLDVKIMLAPGAVVDGKTTHNSVGIDKVNIHIVPPGSAYSLSTKTDAEGEYQFKGLLTDTFHLIGAKKGAEYKEYSVEVKTGSVGTTISQNISLEKSGKTWKFAGTVTEGGKVMAGAYVLLDSSTTKYGKAGRTDAKGKFTFDNVPDGDDYTLTVLPSVTKPLIIESKIAVKSNVTDHKVTVPTLATLKGEITLSNKAAGKHIFVSVINTTDTSAPMQVVKAVDNKNGKYSYSITVKAGDKFKIFAQDLMGEYSIKYHGGDGSFAGSTAVAGSGTSRDITL